MTERQMTFRQFLLQDRRENGSSKDLIFLLEDVATACRIISNHIRSGAFSDSLGATDITNVQGETQKKAGDFVVYFDPLDGSSNLDVNLSVGSIFSVVETKEALDPTDDASVLIRGSDQICAGYAIYGPSTALIITTGNGVNGFTHQQGTGEFRLTYRDMTIPVQTQEFAINASRRRYWEAPVQRYFDECLAGEDGPRGAYFNMRWTASMVAEVHRILTRGGVFLYPIDSANRDQGGKLRLMYEANPMGLVVEQAGGAASTGHQRIMDVEPTSHHQRVSVILGSKDEVALIDGYHNDASH
jgi:fructose-1,6-bisphosphatase I